MFKFIFLILLLLVFVAPLRRFLFWLIVGRQIVKEQKKYQQPKAPVRPEGEIKVEYNPNKNGRQGNDSGQYIDYEEVK
ncbi:MAG TPA: hypothetical protein VK175_07255 [Leadbetterella sp.]|jgi:hypothetical protein|nr:hypothetical protein [Leadbetterella sp.]